MVVGQYLFLLLRFDFTRELAHCMTTTDVQTGHSDNLSLHDSHLKR
jgi:hypothetical protein